MKSLIYMFVVLSIAVVAQTLTWQNPYPQASHLADIKLLPNNKLVAVGDAGVIVTSTDFGNSFTVSYDSNYNPMALKYDLRSIEFVDANTGWIVGGYNSSPAIAEVIKTTDGGNTWVQQQRPQTMLNKICFKNKDSLWTCSSDGVVMTTFDGGENWDGQQINQSAVFKDIKIINNTLFVIGNDVNEKAIMYKSTDFGDTWELVILPNSPTNNSLSSMHVMSNSKAIAVGKTGYIIKTTDSGNTWLNISHSNNSYHFYAVSFANENIGFIVGAEGRILKTVNGGTSWTVVEEFNFYTLLSVYAVNANTIYTTGVGGGMAKSTDGGSNWISLQKANIEYIMSIKFFNKNLGFAISSEGSLLKSVDGGKNWNTYQLTEGNDKLNDMFFIDSLNGWVSGGTEQKAVVYKTSNGGISWSRKEIEEQLGAGIFFTDVNNGYLTIQPNNPFTGSAIYKTTDGGSNWFDLNVPVYDNFGSLFFVDNQYGFAPCIGFAMSEDPMRVLRTTNGGATWDSLLVSDTLKAISLNGVFFLNRNLGWVCGEHGFIAKTTDGGLSWNFPPHLTARWLLKITFVDSLNGWAVGEDGTVIKSTDGGESWHYCDKLITQFLIGICFLDVNTGWIAGQSGAIIKYENDLPTSTKHDYPSITTGYSLEQNYPNPFNPSTTIEYQLPINSHVKLELYSITGEKVATLVDSEMEAGYYNYQLSTSNHRLSSGVYFYRLITNNYSSIRKMVLIK